MLDELGNLDKDDRLVKIEPVPASTISAKTGKPKRKPTEKQLENLKKGQSALKKYKSEKAEIHKEKKAFITETTKRVRKTLRNKLKDPNIGIANLTDPNSLLDVVLDTFQTDGPQSDEAVIHPEQAPEVKETQLVHPAEDLVPDASIEKRDVLHEDILQRLKQLETTLSRYDEQLASQRTRDNSRSGFIFL